jgi:phage terminase large subunit GpA-like protein
MEMVTVGWSRHGVAYILDHRRIEGRWDDDVTWQDLDDYLKSRWRHTYGALMGIDAAAVDTSDGVTMLAGYAFCFPRARRGVIAIKGVPGASVPWIKPSYQKSRGGTLWNVGVDSIKTALFDRLNRPEHIKFSDTLEMDFFEQLTGEKMFISYKRGKPVREFVPVKGRRHEVLDAVVYATAAHRGLNINWDRRASDLRLEPRPAPTTAPVVNYVTGEAA